jgi:hypothetical protein
MEIVFAIIVFVVIPALAVPFGAESRPEFDERQPRGTSRRSFGVLR